MGRYAKLLDPQFLAFLLRDTVRRLEKARLYHDLLRKNPTLKIDDDVHIISPERLSLGKGVLLQKGTVLNCGGMEWCDYRGQITLGDRCAIGPYCVLLGAGEIEMESDSGLAPGVSVISQEGDVLADGLTTKTENVQLRFEKIVFREGAWATTGAIILAGSDIGKKSIIGPGAVVKGKVPPHSLVLGNPGRILALRPTAEGSFRVS